MDKPAALRTSALLVLAMVALATSVHAQARVPLIAVLMHGTETANRVRVEALREGLRELGYREGKSYRMEVRWSDARIERLPTLARELLGLRPDIAVAAPVLAALALHRESKSIPIVMSSGAGATSAGLVSSLAHPGGTVTGLTNQSDELTPKLFELLKEIAPGARRVVAVSSGLAVVEADIRALSRNAAKTFGMTLIEAWAKSADQLQLLSERCRQERCEAMVVLLDPNLNNFRAELVALGETLRIPIVFSGSDFVDAGGLLSYATNAAALSKRAAGYVDKILKGAKPGDLPIEQPTKFDLEINLKAARALGLRVPPSLLVRADRVID
jgi:putative tryptophan/tyrosine transport system substrate-binding protein